MSEPLVQRLIQATRQELARALGELCVEVGAAESSILLPQEDADLVFFASSNAALMQPGTPHVPINASFSGIAYRTGQMIALADAATQEPHFKAVDALLHYTTHEYAAIPLADRRVLGVLSIVNRAPDRSGSRSFTIEELRRAQAFAGEVARALELLPGLGGVTPHEDDMQGLDKGLINELRALSKAERRVTHALASALIHNRAE